MPYFTRQIDAKGLLVNIVFNVSAARASALTLAKQPIPSIFNAQGILDTGASCTCIDPSVIAALGIPPTGKATMVTPSTGEGEVIVDQYDIGLAIYSTLDKPPLRFASLPVVESNLLARQGFHALIGRDVLSQCILNYSGADGTYILAF